MPKVETRGAEDARNQLPDLLDSASRGTATIITRRGKPVAALIPADELSARGRQRSIVRLEGTGRALWGARPQDAIADLRGEWDR